MRKVADLAPGVRVWRARGTEPSAGVPPAVPTGAPLLLLDVDDIRPSPCSPPRDFSESALSDLSEATGRWGQRQPVVVCRTPAGRYELICGERLWRAHVQAGRGTIWAIVQDAPDWNATRSSLADRRLADLSQPELIAALDQLAELSRIFGLRSVARQLHLNPGWLSRRLSILRDPVILPALEEGLIGLGQASDLLSAPADTRRSLLGRILRTQRHVSSATIRAWITELGGHKARRPDPAEAPEAGSAAGEPPRTRREGRPYGAWLNEMEALGTPRSEQECVELFALSLRARQLITASGLSNRPLTLKTGWKSVEVGCLGCGNDIGVLETKVKLRLSREARVRMKGSRLVCGRCGGILFRDERTTPVADAVVARARLMTPAHPPH